MRSTQVLGLLFAVSAFFLGSWILGGVDYETSASAGAGAFFGLMISAIPCIVISAILLVPSSIQLISKKKRSAYGFNNTKWQLLLLVNLVISFGYVCIITFIIFTYIKVKFGLM
ncbi:hypothetical protein [Colwellia sp. 20A7]|uniref:hypothetical protein n=1 Tax=Colwellia sp. 20A7 TaxID=2689569 RepID=UPI00135C2E30|nr:hypothetical protein [Colwellia sp. 20A7]